MAKINESESKSKRISKRISETLTVFKQPNSTRWIASMKIDGKWVRKTTSKADEDEALVAAGKLEMEYNIKAEHNIPLHTSKRAKSHTFGAVARKVVAAWKKQIEEGNGKTVKDYVGPLEQYHIPFFDKTPVKDIDQALLLKFDDHRAEKMKRVPSKSTINTHNAAMNRVFDRAVLDKLLTDREVPVLKNNGGSQGEKRTAFTKDEFKQIVTAIKDSTQGCRKQITAEIRTLLYYYVQVAAYTGIRPGEEMEHLTWGNVDFAHKVDGQTYTAINVCKGKTVSKTGTRNVICRDELTDILKEFRAIQQKTGKGDLMFTLPDGSKTKELSRNFTSLIKKLGLYKSPRGTRTLYSLRHSYITWWLQECKGTDLHVLASQCGHSVEVLQKHYAHVTPSMFAPQLSGREQKNELKVASQVGDINVLPEKLVINSVEHVINADADIEIVAVPKK